MEREASALNIVVNKYNQIHKVVIYTWHHEGEHPVANLENQKCEAYNSNSKHVSDVEFKEYMKQISNWQVIVQSCVKKLKREYIFDNFFSALLFANKVGELAEAHNHHPSLLVEWGKCTVTWWTHEISGLHKTDFILAAKTDRV